MNFTEKIAYWISKCKYCEEMSYEDILAVTEVPADAEMGDYAFPCFRLAKIKKKPPKIIAEELTEFLNEQKAVFIDGITPVNGYVNLFINRVHYAEEILRDVLTKKEMYGSSDIGVGKTVIVEYSSPNVAKHFQMGHLGTTFIGRVLYNLYNELGYKTVGINHLGDWGTQFGKLIVAYKKWGSKEDVEARGIDALTEMYVKFHEEADKDPALNDEARAWMLNMQKGETEALSLWKWFCDLSMREYMETYGRLGVRFDLYRGESYYNDKMDAVVEEIREKGLLTESSGAMIVDLSVYDMPPCLILRSDGGTLYPTRDIAAAIDRHKTFNFDKCLIVTAADQSLHFAQWIKVVSLMGYEWADDIVHIPYGLMSFEWGKMSTRKGHVIKMVDVLNEAVEKTKKIIEEKNPELPDKDAVAEMVGLGAVVFAQLYNNRIKDTTFTWERYLNFDGETGPYLQYTYVRTYSVLEKAGVENADCSCAVVDYSKLGDAYSFEIIRRIEDFPVKIQEAAEKYEPYIVSRYLIALAQAFNKFYHENPIIVEDEKLKMARLALTYAVKVILGKGLGILGIATPVKM